MEKISNYVKLFSSKGDDLKHNLDPVRRQPIEMLETISIVTIRNKLYIGTSIDGTQKMNQ